jgi:hypothetical protein
MALKTAFERKTVSFWFRNRFAKSGYMDGAVAAQNYFI